MESQCAICCDSYLIPRLLNCLHFFCQCCIESLQSEENACCVICGEVTNFSSVRQLPFHPLYFHTANSTTKERLCSVCSQPAAMFCADCDDDYCPACCNVHEKMKVTRGHDIQPANCNPKLLTCQLHCNQILGFYCLECEKLLCNQCNTCDTSGHHIITTSEACKAFKNTLQLENSSKLNNILDLFDVAKSNFLKQKKQEKDHGLKLKQEINQKTNYIISMLQSREKLLCEQVDGAVDSNISLIETRLAHTKKNLEELTTFIKVCEEWCNMPVDNALLQLKPLVDQRFQYMVEKHKSPVGSPLLDSILFTDQASENILPLVNAFGNIKISKNVPSPASYKRKWSCKLHKPMSFANSNHPKCVYTVETLWDARKQKVRVKEISRAGELIKDVWACSKSCKSPTDIVHPVITSDADEKTTIAVGIGHEVILINSETKKSYKFGKHGTYPGQLHGISSLAFSSGGNILVADNILNRVSMFSSEGEFILCFGTSRKNVGASEHSLNNPSAILVDKRDHVYIADTDNHRIAVFNHEGCFMKCIGSKGSRSGEFNEPCDMALSGVLAVLERGNCRIQFVSLEYDNVVVGALYLDTISLPRHVIWMTRHGEDDVILSGDVLVADNDSIYQYSLSSNSDT